MEVRLNGIHDLGSGEILDPMGIDELGHCLLDLGPLLCWYMVVVEVLGLVGAELSADLHRLGVVHFEALVGSVHILDGDLEPLRNLGRLEALYPLQAHHLALLLELLGLAPTLDGLLVDQLLEWVLSLELLLELF